MTIQQAGAQYGVPIDKLRYYEEQGLFDCHKQPDGSIDYNDQLMSHIGLINVLVEAGATPAALRGFMRQVMQGTLTKGDELLFLRRQRQQLLSHIHTKQKALDRLDYLIYEAGRQQ